MGRKPNPPVVPVEELERLNEDLKELKSDFQFQCLMERLEYLYSRNEISLFGYYAEILSFITLTSVTDPEWVREFSEITSRYKGSQPTVTIPLAMLGALTEAWGRYREADHNLSLGRAAGVEAKGKASGQGLSNDRDAFNALEVDEYLALQVLVTQSHLGQTGKMISVGKAIDEVAVQFEGYDGPGRVGRKRIARAHREHGQRLLDRLRMTGAEITYPNLEKSED
ncbi:hypothetical protein M1105_05480 [Limibaculum sp. FT325]|uniref:hypothetical protein n=1 Tax=Thermohalobaculum sediminis TaxID=2939436 RepID=UPI0020BE3010|nr:hypothetical protein [Limibaculum sediminis]MCL5776437.1 hypothetical protein [Limibaculum sediminis]